jgi:exonuclease VII small subunit
MWKDENKNDGPQQQQQHMTDMLTIYKEAVEEFSLSAAEFLAHIPLLTKARDAYQRAMAVSSQLRQVLDKGDETLRLIMSQMEQASNIQFAAPTTAAGASDKKRPEPVKLETPTAANGDKANAAHA